MSAIPLSRQLACAKREVALRRNVYPKWVASGRWKQEKATEEIDCMAAIVETLERAVLLEQMSDEMKAAEQERMRKACNGVVE